ncbi:hypothetical protein CJ030_MR2G023222 [Morella rubra]|uniref:Uncharacterized protein n=1 Tax=Morella rubra TaxID=262757 RepID=A0A6A1WFR2_9ROSI|nr:hypothetical protein CJ030_MR2G023222 [Morella rubra]
MGVFLCSVERPTREEGKSKDKKRRNVSLTPERGSEREQKVPSLSDSSPCAVKRGLQFPNHPPSLHSVPVPLLQHRSQSSITEPPNDATPRSSFLPCLPFPYADVKNYLLTLVLS